MNGAGFAALLLTFLIGYPIAYWLDVKKKPGVGAPGEDKN